MRNFNYTDPISLAEELALILRSGDLPNEGPRNLDPIGLVSQQLEDQRQSNRLGVIEAAVTILCGKVMRGALDDDIHLDVFIIGSCFPSLELAINCCEYICNIHEAESVKFTEECIYIDLLFEIILSNFSSSDVRAMFLSAPLVKATPLYLHKVMTYISRYSSASFAIVLDLFYSVYEYNVPKIVIDYFDRQFNISSLANSINTLRNDDALDYLLMSYIQHSRRFSVEPIGIGDLDNDDADQSIYLRDWFEDDEFGLQKTIKLNGRNNYNRSYSTYLEQQTNDPNDIMEEMNMSAQEYLQ